jgi:phasin family protein
LQCTIIISVNEKYLMRSKENAMFSTPQQLSAATKASVEARLDLINAVTSKAFEGLEKVIDLNIHTVKTSLEESAAAARKLLTIKSPQEFFTLATQTQPNFEKMLSYGRLLADISSRMQTELLQVTREQLAETQGAMTQQLPNPASPKAASAPRGNAFMTASKTTSKTDKSEEKLIKSVKVVNEPTITKPATKKVAATTEAKALPNKTTPAEPKDTVKPAATAAATKPVVENVAAKPVAPAAAPVTAAAVKTEAEKPAVKPTAAAPSTPVAKPDVVTAPAVDKNTSKKK